MISFPSLLNNFGARAIRPRQQRALSIPLCIATLHFARHAQHSRLHVRFERHDWYQGERRQCQRSLDQAQLPLE